MKPWLPTAIACLFLLAAGVCRAGPTGPVRRVACAPGRPDTAAVLVGWEVWTTADGGRSWRNVARLPGAPEPSSNDGSTDRHGALQYLTDPDDEPEESPALRRIEWSDEVPEPAAAEQPAAEESPALAVADSGAWAAARGGRVFVGGPGPGIRQRLELPGLKGLLFDSSGRLWAVAGGSLHLLGQGGAVGRETRRWPVPGATAPVVGAPPHQLAVPGRDGLWLVGGDGETSPSPRLLPARGARTAAAHPADGGYLVVSFGRLSWLGPGETPAPRGTVPPRTEVLLLERTGAVYARTRSAGWFARDGDRWSPAPFREAAVDGAGRLWRGTERGPVSPAGYRAVPAGSRADGGSFARLVARSGAHLAAEPGPPPCRRLPWNPLPRARLFGSWGRSAHLVSDPSNPVSGAGAKSWYYVGFLLTWSLDPPDPVSCLSARERWVELRRERMERIESLWRLARRVPDPAAAADPHAGAAADLQRRELEELVQITAGALPRDKERP